MIKLCIPLPRKKQTNRSSVLFKVHKVHGLKYMNIPKIVNTILRYLSKTSNPAGIKQIDPSLRVLDYFDD